MAIIIGLLIVFLIIISVFLVTTLTHKSKTNNNFPLPEIKTFNMIDLDQITYYKGDVLEGITENNIDETRILLHICNNRGGWGAGFVLALSKKWKQPEMEYRECFRKKINFELGKIQPVKIEDNIHVVNMVAQNGYRTVNNPTPLDYNALSECLNTVMVWIDENNFISPVIYCPKIGTGLSGGDWEHIKQILQNELSEIPIRVYEL